MSTATKVKIQKVELKSIKVHMDVSEETICYSANIYINGKKVGSIDNSGRGGESMIHTDHFNELQEWSKLQPNEIFMEEESFDKYGLGKPRQGEVGPEKTYEEYMAEPNAKNVIDLFDHISFETHEHKSMARKGKNSIHFKLQDTPDNQWVLYKKLAYNEANLTWLKEKHGSDIKEIYDPTVALDFKLVY
jgi:hypothetical protein